MRVPSQVAWADRRHHSRDASPQQGRVVSLSRCKPVQPARLRPPPPPPPPPAAAATAAAAAAAAAAAGLLLLLGCFVSRQTSALIADTAARHCAAIAGAHLVGTHLFIRLRPHTEMEDPCMCRGGAVEYHDEAQLQSASGKHRTDK